MFTKTLNGKTTIVSYVSHTPHDLTVQTMYSGRKKLTLKAQGQMHNPLSLTPETNCATGSTASNIENSASEK